MRVILKSAIALLTATALLAGSPGSARAQSAEASPSGGKGILGGALLGGEIVVATEAAFGVEPVWAYLVGAAAGAGAGGVAGYYLEQGSSSRPPTYLVAAGIALVVPAMIVVLNATQYRPPANQQRDDGDLDGALGARLQLPELEVRDTYTADERHRLQVEQAAEYHLSFLRGEF
jgi:hypothetical protein